MRGYGEGKGRGSEMVTASEIAAFVYCPEAWRLEHGLGLEAGNREAMAAGERHHGRKAAAERVAGGFIGIGRLVAVLAVVALLLLLWWWL
jgi:hypothetical protein